MPLCIIQIDVQALQRDEYAVGGGGLVLVPGKDCFAKGVGDLAAVRLISVIGANEGCEIVDSFVGDAFEDVDAGLDFRVVDHFGEHWVEGSVTIWVGEGCAHLASVTVPNRLRQLTVVAGTYEKLERLVCCTQPEGQLCLALPVILCRAGLWFGLFDIFDHACVLLFNLQRVLILAPLNANCAAFK